MADEFPEGFWPANPIMEKALDLLQKAADKSKGITRREALISMGYRECGSTDKPWLRWLKPVGYHLFAFDEREGIWLNYFKSVDGKVSVWQSHEPSKDPNSSFLEELKYWECFSRTDMYLPSEFQLSGIDM